VATAGVWAAEVRAAAATVEAARAVARAVAVREVAEWVVARLAAKREVRVGKEEGEELLVVVGLAAFDFV